MTESVTPAQTVYVMTRTVRQAAWLNILNRSGFQVPEMGVPGGHSRPGYQTSERPPIRQPSIVDRVRPDRFSVAALRGADLDRGEDPGRTSR